MSHEDVIEDAERRTRRKFYKELISRLTVVPDPADEDARETFEYHVGDVAWAAHLMANACGQEAVLDVLSQLTRQLSESDYWNALERQRQTIKQNIEDMREQYPELWEQMQKSAHLG